MGEPLSASKWEPHREMTNRTCLEQVSPPADHRVERPHVDSGQPLERSGAHGRGRLYHKRGGGPRRPASVSRFLFVLLLTLRYWSTDGARSVRVRSAGGWGGAGRERTRRRSTRSHPEPGRAPRQRRRSTGRATSWEARPSRAAPPASPASPRLCLLSAVVSRGGAAAARWAHNPKVVGSNPTPATIPLARISKEALPNRGRFLSCSEEPELFHGSCVADAGEIALCREQWEMIVVIA